MNYAGTRMIQLNDEEVAIAGNKKVYLIDIKKFQILNEISSDSCHFSILKLSNCLFLAGDDNGTIIQYKVENKKLIKISWKNKVHKGYVWSMNKINNMIISGGSNGDIILWKK
jgi:WD40 repeat protein